MRRTGAWRAALLLFCAIGLAAPALAGQPPALILRVRAIDSQDLPIPGATCSVRGPAGTAPAVSSTNADGVAEFHVAPGSYTVRVDLDGFGAFTADVKVSPGTNADVVALLQPALNELVTVSAPDNSSATGVSAGAAPAAAVLPSALKRLPIDVGSVENALPLVPGVVRSGTGELNLKGASEEQSAFLLNGVSATDPSNGGFRLTLPVDAVEAVQVFMHPYTAEYGQFTGGLTEFDTRSGGDHWHAELNDFLPDLRWVHGAVVGIAADTPHVNVNGPLVAKHLFLSESASYQVMKRPIRGLEFPDNETKTTAQSYFTQLDAMFSTRHTQTLTVGYFPAQHDFVGLDVFRPKPVTPSASQHDLVVTVKDQSQIGGGLLSSSMSFTRFDTNVWAQGASDMTLTPFGATGNYFATQDRNASRAELLEVFTMPTVHRYGAHDLKFGVDVKLKSESLQYDARPIDIVRADGTLARRITFDAAPLIRAGNNEYVAFAQDRWSVAPDLTLDLGVRYEDQRIADAAVVAPRAGFAWAPGGGATIIRGGAGFFYGSVPLNLRAFGQYPARTVTRYAPDGTLLSQLRLPNLLVGADTLNFVAPGAAGDQAEFVPQNFTANLQVDRTVTSWLTLRANVISSDTENAYVVDRNADAEHQGFLVLRSNGRAQYRAAELTGRIGPSAHAITVSYTRSQAVADLNDFESVLGDFAVPVIYPNQYARTSADVPNRFLAWGALPLPRRITLAPVFEVRSGFPYTPLNEEQSLAGPRNSLRFPTFVALDLEASKDLHLVGRYDVRLSLRAFNITNHFNPRDVRANTADPLFGTFLASYRRYFAGGFDILF